MLSKEDESFLMYWSQNREKQRTSMQPFFIGLSAGIAMGVIILVCLTSGWFERADMVANSQMSSVIFMLAVVLLSLFMAFMYRKFSWEMKEQRYLELLATKKKQENKIPKQP